MKVTIENVLGMDLERMEFKSCVAHFGVGDDWATLYSIRSQEEGKGHATQLLQAAKVHYKEQGKKLGGSIALNERMRGIYKRLKIPEYRNFFHYPQNKNSNYLSKAVA